MDDQVLSQVSDEALAAMVALRDVSAFGTLYDRYAPVILGMASHMLGAAEAEEAAQEVFLRLWDRSSQFDPQRGSFRTWLYAIARNHILDLLRRRQQRQRVAAAETIDGFLALAVPSTDNVEEEVWTKACGDAVVRCLQRIPPEQRRAVILAYFGGMSQSEIAEHLQWPLGTVKKRIRLGLQKLRTLLAQEGILEGVQKIGTDVGLDG